MRATCQDRKKGERLMLLYLVPVPENKLDLKGRETGWHRVPLDRESKKEFRERLKQLGDKGVEYVLGSDLDTEAVHVAANELHLPIRIQFELRRFNLGKHHAAPADTIDGVLRALIEQWKVNPDIPIRAGGDSLTSYQRRFVSFVRKTLTEKGTAALVTDLRSIRMMRDFDPNALINNGNPVFRNKIYVLKGE
jgi:broad specificity phosphatase PhoE